MSIISFIGLVYLFKICETLSLGEERVAQRGSGGPIPGSIQDHVGQGSEQPDLVSGVPACCGGVGLDDL